LISEMEAALAVQNPRLLQEFASGLEDHLLPAALSSG
jgi:hypothetical protein